MTPPLNLAGTTFNRWTVIKKVSETGKSVWLCRCVCGEMRDVRGSNLMNGKSKSCGCLHKEIISTHRMSKDPTYNSWKSCVNRCSEADRKYYGAEGVTVCDRWVESFENFLEDMGERPEGTTLNRVGGAKVYSKETCEWVNNSIQGFDKRLASNNKTGVTGVRWDQHSSRYKAQISFKGRQIHLGTFKDFDSAVSSRLLAETKYYGFILTDRRSIDG